MSDQADKIARSLNDTQFFLTSRRGPRWWRRWTRQLVRTLRKREDQKAWDREDYI